MKTIFLVLITSAFVSIHSFGQYNLQFNKVITYAGSFGSGSSDTWQVPAGKIWKIESMTNSFIYSSSQTPCYLRFILNNIPIHNYFSGSAAPSALTNSNVFPIWLKAGDAIKFTMSCPSTSLTYYISIIEYNLVP